MAKLKVHYDGWICLPATIRRRLGISSGDELDIDYAEGGLVIRSEISMSIASPAPVKGKKRAPVKKPAAAMADEP
ncbi:MAG: AbrB/MazE/SpoVT family DNA-binding domain-containing protein, partial [Geminicoccaceae bacterium]|nr:AbrB/MazE/SpoVT family DNA-binding domain-containing protein [Geminicoccaceae bacterium]